jgi:hypothetical protein
MMLHSLPPEQHVHRSARMAAGSSRCRWLDFLVVRRLRVYNCFGLSIWLVFHGSFEDRFDICMLTLLHRGLLARAAFGAALALSSHALG